MEFVSLTNLIGELAVDSTATVDYDVIFAGVRKHCGFVLTEKDGTVNIQNSDKQPWIIIKNHGNVSIEDNVIVLDRSNPELVEAILDGADNAPFMNLYV